MTEYVYAIDGQQGHWFTGEEIVRCRDCCYYEPDGEPSEVDASWHWCDRMMQYLNPDGFCKWAKRRDA